METQIGPKKWRLTESQWSSGFKKVVEWSSNSNQLFPADGFNDGTPNPNSLSSPLGFLQQVLGPVREISLTSLSKMKLCDRFKPAPLEIRDVSTGQSLFKVVTVNTGRFVRQGKTVREIFDFNVIDASGRILISMEMPRTDMKIEHTVSMDNQLVASFTNGYGLNWKLLYKLNRENTLDNSVVLVAKGVSVNVCCWATRTIHFRRSLDDLGDGSQSIAEMKNEPVSSGLNPNSSNIQFLSDCNALEKIWIMCIGWHIHIANFGETCIGPYGSRRFLNIVLAVVFFGYFLLIAIVLGIGLATDSHADKNGTQTTNQKQ